MKISNSEMENIHLSYRQSSVSQNEKLILNYSRTARTAEAKETDSTQIKIKVKEKADSVSINIKSKDFHKAKELYAQLPEVRLEKIEEVKERLNCDGYASSENIARQIVSKSLIDGEV